MLKPFILYVLWVSIRFELLPSSIANIQKKRKKRKENRAFFFGRNITHTHTHTQSQTHFKCNKFSCKQAHNCIRKRKSIILLSVSLTLIYDFTWVKKRKRWVCCITIPIIVVGYTRFCWYKYSIVIIHLITHKKNNWRCIYM